jgi:hypothetical protein
MTDSYIQGYLVHKIRLRALDRSNIETGLLEDESSDSSIQLRRIWKQNPTPSEPSKMSPRAQKMKTGPGALGTAQN